MKKTPELLNKGSLITYMDGDKERCLGYLLIDKEHGIFEPHFGKMNLTTEEAEIHNKLLSEGEILGLDNNCEVGMMGTLYFINGKVTTWMGTLVSDQVKASRAGFAGIRITFYRNNRKYVGYMGENTSAFTFKRIS